MRHPRKNQRKKAIPKTTRVKQAIIATTLHFMLVEHSEAPCWCWPIQMKSWRSCPLQTMYFNLASISSFVFFLQPVRLINLRGEREQDVHEFVWSEPSMKLLVSFNTGEPLLWTSLPSHSSTGTMLHSLRTLETERNLHSLWEIAPYLEESSQGIFNPEVVLEQVWEQTEETARADKVWFFCRSL